MSRSRRRPKSSFQGSFEWTNTDKFQIQWQVPKNVLLNAKIHAGSFEDIGFCIVFLFTLILEKVQHSPWPEYGWEKTLHRGCHHFFSLINSPCMLFSSQWPTAIWDLMVATQSIQNFVLSITLALTRLPVLAGRHHEPTMQKRSEEKKNDRIAMQVLSHRVCHQKICCWSTWPYVGQKPVN